MELQAAVPGNVKHTMQRPARLRSDTDRQTYTPVHVVWEITLACNLKCQHCGSRAGRPRPNELSTEECLDIVDRLARMGTREVTLIGGEAYLRRDWIEIVKRIRSYDMYCAIQTGGRALTDKRLDTAIEAGLQGLGVSIDGLEELHDTVRGVPGSYEMAFSALRRAKAAGLNTTANTQIGPRTIDQLEELMERLIGVGVTHWQLQLTVAMGNAVDNDALLLQPHQLEELMPLLARLYFKGREQGFLIVPGNNIGYFGPYEHLWRNASEERGHWTGCSAGQTGMGLESDGTVKGCPSLATVGYSGGNIRDMDLEEIWQTSPAIHFGRLRSADQLWGFCRTCYYADVCRAGCTWTSHSLLGKPGNNPYCHYRVSELARHGLRERISKTKEAPQASFAVGEFELILEPIPGRVPTWNVEADGYPGPRAPHAGAQAADGIVDWANPVPPQLARCPSCYRFMWDSETDCPFCGANQAEAREGEAQERLRQQQVMAELRALLDGAART